jgi:predicted N-formylglutamate amidohydrolase
MATLLTDRDPAPFGERNPDGTSRLLFISDHHRNAVPASLDRLGLPDDELGRHIGYDIGIEWAGNYLSDRFDAPMVHSCFSRLVIDCNRVPGGPGSMPEVADGTEVPGNWALTDAQREARRLEIFEPYHDAIRRRIHAMEADGRMPVVIGLHSFTPQLRDGGTWRPWEIGILWNEDERLARPLIEALREDLALSIGDNEPYSGRDSGVGFSLYAHPEARGLPHVAVEFRQDLIGDKAGARKWAEIFGNALEIALASITL